MDWLARTAPCGLVALSMDETIETVNDTFLEWLGLPADEVIGRSFLSLLDPSSKLFYEMRHAPVLRLEREARDATLTLVRGDGSGLPVLADSAVRGVGDGERILVAMFNATMRIANDQRALEVQRENERLARRLSVLQAASVVFSTAVSEDELCESLAEVACDAFDAPDAGIFLLDGEGRFVLRGGTNPLEEAMRDVESPGLGMRALNEGKVIVVRNLAEAEALSPALADAFRASRVESLTISPIIDEGHAIGVMTAFFQRPRPVEEVSLELKEALTKQAAQVLMRIRLQQRVQELAMHDHLTGLPHRKLFDDQLQDFLSEAVAEHGSLSLLFLDLDGFKAVNDVLGHPMGDALLAQVGRRIRATVRDVDAVGRYGGDEFVIACRRAGEDVAMQVAERVRAAIEEPFEGVPPQPAVSVSIGVAVVDAVGGLAPDLDHIVRVADTAMYESKATGRNRITLVRA